jgi:hypothetical protein
MADVTSLVKGCLPDVQQLLQVLAERAFKAAEEECAEKQQERGENIRRLETELTESRQRNNTLTREAAARAIQLASAMLDLAQSSVL